MSVPPLFVAGLPFSVQNMGFAELFDTTAHERAPVLVARITVFEVVTVSFEEVALTKKVLPPVYASPALIVFWELEEIRPHAANKITPPITTERVVISIFFIISAISGLNRKPARAPYQSAIGSP